MFLEEFDFEIDNEVIIEEDVDFKIDIKRIEVLGKVNDYFRSKYLFVTDDSVACVASHTTKNGYHLRYKLKNGVVATLDIPKEEYKKVENAYK